MISDLEQAARKAVIDWRDHCKVETRDEALLLIEETVPDSSDAERSQVLHLTLAAHERAIATLPRSVKRRFKLHPFASARDIDRKQCLAELDEVAPQLSREAKAAVLEWVIYWHWSR